MKEEEEEAGGEKKENPNLSGEMSLRAVREYRMNGKLREDGQEAEKGMLISLGPKDGLTLEKQERNLGCMEGLALSDRLPLV